ncbi:LAFE_0F10110g1_1 [Lachancea fermentati]|uniref:CDP-diacylglycerol--glycerol-3-phosphate 3-phosphatidyltransferase n=1 Tax=Lachancea fermentati TaxID=4955 RepID=A0A1G4MFL3_LACFM|nr:LAFE_0F10110g1_1 [Lachancea fermentati]
MLLNLRRGKRSLGIVLLSLHRSVGSCQNQQMAISRNTTRQEGRTSYVDIVKNRLSTLKSRFFFKPGDIEILNSPLDFYDSLKRKISLAERRIFMASLYLGTSQDELINCISEALQRKPELKVYFLVDGLRGTRETPNKCSASLLAQLVQKHGDRVDIRLYRTPEFTNLKKALIPKRLNEGVGLQHMKIYGFDDEVILSGANLSTDYFTNRQDRYYIFKSKSFSDYYFRLHQLVSKISYKVLYSTSLQKYSMVWPSSNLTVEPISNRKTFLNDCSIAFQKFLNDPGTENRSHAENQTEYPTVVYPVSQFTPLFGKNADHSTEKRSILNILSSIPSSNVRWTFTAGYFNMLPEIKKLLIASPSKQGCVITASPFANGFFESKGVSSHLPDAYLHLSHKFLKEVEENGKSAEISLKEWRKGIVNTPGGWSYHAKGIWLSDNDENDTRPAITVIGSSNYTRRAYSVDLESNAIIVTRDSDLKQKMEAEIEKLQANTSDVTLSDFQNDCTRKVSPGVRMATKILGKRL